MTDVIPKKLQRAAVEGMKRLRNFRDARLMFLRNYTGAYYDKRQGEIGKEALNLIFNAIRIIVPNIVMNFPIHKVDSQFINQRAYADLLAKALSFHDKQIGIDRLYRRMIVDAIFTLGIIKTGLAANDSVFKIDDTDSIAEGEIYSEIVDFDNLVIDPTAEEHLFRDAEFIGDKITIPRQNLLESGLYNNEFIERLPAIGSDFDRKRASSLTKASIRSSDARFLREEVSIIELWVPGAHAMVTIPGDDSIVFSDFLRVDDYYGPNEGPYTFLGLTPPVPGNPLPVPLVGIWNDLHILANKMLSKISQQAINQRSLLLYRRAAADDAEEVMDSQDGDGIGVDDPSFANVVNFGGQQQSNEIHLSALNSWFNLVAANPQGVGGQRFDAQSATEARILQQNANVGLEDMKDLVYKAAASEARKRAWYMHTDPFINIPLTKRIQVPAQFQQTPQGPQMTQPAQLVDEQIFLTPEARSGDFLDFSFTIRPESMGRKDSEAQFLQAVDFATKILPSAMQAAQVAALLGIAFSPQRFIIRMAEDRGIDWMEEVFFDPDFQMQLATMQAQSPQIEGSVGVPPQRAGGGLNQIIQNGQPGSVRSRDLTPRQTEQSQAQSGGIIDQRVLAGLNGLGVV